jgi:predicted ATP-dependent serine protease
MTSPCEHEKLDQRGRCLACGEWAVLTGQVPVKPVLGVLDEEHKVHG